MPSPFPGMDPYVESPGFWGDFQFSMVVAIKAQLNQSLPEQYSAWAERYVSEDDECHWFLKIGKRSLPPYVTIIEVLSPEQKGIEMGSHREPFLSKHRGANLVDVDLFRASPHTIAGRANDQYCVSVFCPDKPDRILLWTLSVRDKLPRIPIPLGTGEAPVVVRLRPCLVRTYDEGRYAGDIDYSKPPEPPLSESDAAWARKLLKAKKILAD